jgi:hypothetical protein
MQDVIERVTALGVESTGTFMRSSTAAQQQSAELVQSWFRALDANQQVSQEITLRLVQQFSEASATWQRFLLSAAQTVDPFTTLSRLRQLQDCVDRLDALNRKIDANARQAETAARKARAAIDALASLQEQGADGARRAEAAAGRAQEICGQVETASAQVLDGVKRAETAARRAQDASRDARTVNQQVTGSAQRAEAAAARAQQMGDSVDKAAGQTGATRNDRPAAARRSRAAAKPTETAAPSGEQSAERAPTEGDGAGA